MICQAFALLKFIFVEDKKQKLCRYTIINELTGQKWAIKLMDDLTDDRLLTASGEMTFELIHHYLPIFMED